MIPNLVVTDIIDNYVIYNINNLGIDVNEVVGFPSTDNLIDFIKCKTNSKIITVDEDKDIIDTILKLAQRICEEQSWV